MREKLPKYGRVIRLVTNTVWKDPKFPVTAGQKIIWEPGLVYEIVAYTLHPEEASTSDLESLHRLYRKYPGDVLWIMRKARGEADRLARFRNVKPGGPGKSQASALQLLLLLDLPEIAPVGINTDHGALEEAAAEILGVNIDSVHRKFEHAKRQVAKIEAAAAKDEELRLNSIEGPNELTARYPDVAKMFPRAFSGLEKHLRLRRKKKSA